MQAFYVEKNGIITYIEYTSNSFLIFCFLLHQVHHHMSSKGSMTLGDLFDMDMDLGSHKNSQKWASCSFAWLPKWLRLHGFLLHMEFSVFSQCLFTCRANRLCFHNASCYWCNALCFHSAFSPAVRIGCVFVRIRTINAMPCVFIEPF